MSMELTIDNIDQEQGWTKQWSPDINPIEATGYEFVQLPDGLRLYMTGKPYSAWLCRYVLPLLAPFQKISFGYNLMIDDCTQQQAQVIETDSKITDAAGWTYDLSAQFNIQKGWMFEIDKVLQLPGGDWAWTWTETGLKIIPPSPNIWAPVRIDYELDYVKHLWSIPAVTVGGVSYPLPDDLQRVPAKQVGWQKSTIVMQLQQCNNALEGAHSEKFSKVGYRMS